MTDFVYKIITSDGEVWWFDNADDILRSFGTVEEVTRYMVVDPVDITDDINGDYFVDE